MRNSKKHHTSHSYRPKMTSMIMKISDQKGIKNMVVKALCALILSILEKNVQLFFVTRVFL